MTETAGAADGLNSPEPYLSANDLPSVVEMRRDLRGMKALTRVIARDQRAELVALERQLDGLVTQVDSFYELLGPRNWIYHEQMNTEVIGGIIELDVADAERALIEYYKDPEVLEFMVRRLGALPEMTVRMDLVRRAEQDFHAGRYYATVLVLIAAMDGLVNDLESARRRGLHACDGDELSAWDSVVGHHSGLSRVHRTFTKTFSKSSNDEVQELYRNGFVHGTLTNFDNDVVATKAWNRLFAVADWAGSVKKQAVPPAPEPSWRDVIGQIKANAENKAALDQWQPTRVAKGDAGFEEDALTALVREYLGAWRAENYGVMGSHLASLSRQDSPGKTAGRVRDEYSLVALEAFDVQVLNYCAAAVCEVEVHLTSDGEVKAGRMRWIREDEAGEPALPQQSGQWRLISWGPWAMLNPGPRDPGE